MSPFIPDIILIVLLLAASAFLSSSETAFFSLRPHDIEDLEEKGYHKAKALMKMPGRLLITILLSNLAVNILFAATVERISVYYFGSNGVWIAVLAGTLLILVFGEVTPKTYAIRNNVLVARITAGVISLLHFLLAPLVGLITSVTRRITSIRSWSGDEAMTEDEILSYLTEIEGRGGIDSEERMMIHSIFDLDRTRAVDLMIPRNEVFALPRETTVGEALEAVRRTGYTRIPVFAGSLDNIIGILYAKDLLGRRDLSSRIFPTARPAVTIPRWKKADDLLRQLQAERAHMAVVTDEYGAVSGLVFLEDLLERIIGKIRDEPRGDGNG